MADNVDEKSDGPDAEMNPVMEAINLPSPSPSMTHTEAVTTKAEGEGDSKVETVPIPAVAPDLLPESPEARDAYLQREIRKKLKQLKEKQEKVADLFVQVESLELKIYYVGYITNEAIEEMRDQQASKYSEGPADAVNPVIEVMEKAPKTKQMEGESQLKTSTEEKGKGAAGSQDTYKQPMEKEYERVLQLLEDDQGAPEMMKELFDHALNEAKRFGCRDLISYLEIIARRRSTHVRK